MANRQYGQYGMPDDLTSGYLEANSNSITAPAFTEESEEMTEDDRKAVIAEGNSFAASEGTDPWLLISGHLDGGGSLAEDQLMKSLISVFGYPRPEDKRTINVLLDSKGGSLDSAFKMVRYLSRYASEVSVYVPRRAKSASTLIAVGGHHLFLSYFGELGPLDTQIHDPRNRTAFISALDCYQSVDYVRDFGFATIRRLLRHLVAQAGDLIQLPELLDTSTKFAIGSIAPMMGTVTALDFGGWGRSLKIGEQYARLLLLSKNPTDEEKANRISELLVYGYPHHPFPIDLEEAGRLGLDPSAMPQKTYEGAMHVVKKCDGKAFIGFISKEQSELQENGRETEREGEASIERERALANVADKTTSTP